MNLEDIDVFAWMHAESSALTINFKQFVKIHLNSKQNYEFNIENEGLQVANGVGQYCQVQNINILTTLSRSKHTLVKILTIGQ